MVTEMQNQLDAAVAEMKAFFNEGRLDDKQAEANVLLQSGQVRYFEGEVNWSVDLPDFDRRLRGESENLAAAVADICSGLKLLQDDYGNDANVTLSVALAGEG